MCELAWYDLEGYNFVSNDPNTEPKSTNRFSYAEVFLIKYIRTEAIQCSASLKKSGHLHLFCF